MAKTFLSAYFNEAGQHFDITNQDISGALKLAATFLVYPTIKGIPIDRIDTHSLRSSGANALLLAGYSNIKIQKMGRWHGATSKEYIQEELAFFLEGMPCSMKQKLQFANVAGISFNTITDDLISTDYNVNVSTKYTTPPIDNFKQIDEDKRQHQPTSMGWLSRLRSPRGGIMWHSSQDYQVYGKVKPMRICNLGYFFTLSHTQVKHGGLAGRHSSESHRRGDEDNHDCSDRRQC